ncbi:uncharacterized protein LOC114277071 [Camellia sinensis]|uniref:uncharacterized protein LOC114277071 n=1 Tax=Camellia sinensis TaxID=4442 RepID=UPI0010364E81|nr:uncharacterized protein LOC114277071 [Camellia sinensis]
MDKSWMKKSRLSRDYMQGIKEFLEFASHNVSNDGTISCPCMRCVNSYMLTLEVVHHHLVFYGISPGYNCWYLHGEIMSATTSSRTSQSHEEIRPEYGDIRDMLRDVFPMHTQNMDEYAEESNLPEPSDQGPSVQRPQEDPNEDAQKFYDLLKDAEKPLYEGCKNFSKLSAIVHLYHLKCLNGWSNHSFTMLLQILRDMLPSDANLPKASYDAKKIIKDLGLGYEKIHACPNDCMLFWKEHANDEVCHCGASRWATNENDLQHNMSTSSKKRKKKAAKVLRWFPLKPRLQRLFMSSKTAAYMKWHAEGRTNDGIMRHPADSMAWKTFDSRYVDFSFDSRNVRLGLAADGFNPYGNMSTSYSISPVILVPYNLPPWMCMKRSSFILSLLIPGPSSPSNDIDVYMQPLVEELKELWDVGVQTYDISSKENFQMHIALMWTINDFPAYGDLSGWNTKGALACPSSNYETHSRWLKHGGKYCFMGHRRFLDKDHRFRKDRASFDGKQEIESAPDILSGFEIMMQTEDLDYKFGKTKANEKNKKRKKQADGDEIQPWKKRSIFFTLSYWANQKLCHNLDVMHIEKNVIDNVYGTLLNLDGKTKDNLKARLDLQEMGIRRELHPQKISSNKTYLPPACFSMILKEKDDFLKVLKGVKVPDGYASNISRCIQLRQRKIIGLKSHDGHILMQQLLPIALRGTLPKKSRFTSN